MGFSMPGLRLVLFPCFMVLMIGEEKTGGTRGIGSWVIFLL